MSTTEQTFEEAVEEFFDKSTEMIGFEAMEFIPPPPPAPYPQEGPPFVSALRFDSNSIRNYAYSIGDDNPLYTDPEYARRSIYGTQIAPGPIMSLVRYPTAHGPERPQGYPVANFISGAAWEFYDVIRVNSRFSSSMTVQESFEKPGAQGRLLFLISDVYYWDQTGELKAKCYGTQIHVPIRTMETGRAMKVERAGEQMMYSRGTQTYTDEQIEQIVADLEAQQRRGAEPRYWEDVEVGEELPPFLLPPFTCQDQIAHHRMNACLTTSMVGSRFPPGFEPAYHQGKEFSAWTRTNPITRWPYAPGSEHEDAVLAVFRGQPGPFDFGVQRAQIPQGVLMNWMGDHGFIRRMYTAFRRPVFYGDTTWYHGTVVKKYTVTEEGDDSEAGVSGKADYHAVAIEMKGVNQAGEVQCPGFATVYLPSREYGPVQLPVPHVAQPAFVPYETFRRVDWY